MFFGDEELAASIVRKISGWLAISSHLDRTSRFIRIMSVERVTVGS